MLLRTISIAVLIGVSGCGGSDIDGTPTTNDGEQKIKDLEIYQSGQSINVSSSTPLNNVLISGNNNVIKFITIPKSISVSGNDNTIYRPEGIGIISSGLGNVVIEPTNESPTLN
jgi:hypothetical protein